MAKSSAVSFDLAIKVRKEFISKILARIVETKFFIEVINLLDILIFKPKGDIEILINSLWRLGLWNDRSAMMYAPGYEKVN